jgi:NTE family protein
MATRALVLGGGGFVGIAWKSGLLAGLSESGVDLARADLIVGTSAGSFVGAQVAVGRSAATIVHAILAEDAAEVGSFGGRPMKVPDLAVLFAKMAEAVSGARPAEQVRAEIGAWALSAEATMSEQEFIAGFGRLFSGLPADFWPERPYACTAVDAADGSFPRNFPRLAHRARWGKESNCYRTEAEIPTRRRSRLKL